MARGWSINCPKHDKAIYTCKTIPFNRAGVRENAPIFYCEDCGKYYLSTNAFPKGVETDYQSSVAKNIDVIPKECDVEEQQEFLPSSVYEYTDPFVPITCLKDGTELKKITAKVRTKAGVRTVAGLFCEKCHDLHVETDEYDELTDGCEIEFQKVFKREKQKAEYHAPEPDTESEEDDDNEQYQEPERRKYSLEEISVEDQRKKREEIKAFLGKYEDIDANFQKDFPFSKLHYAFLFRRFDVVFDMLLSFENELEKILRFQGPSGYEWITPLVCAKWNLYYLYAYDDKNNTHIVDMLEPYLDEVENIDELLEYDEIVAKAGQSVFEVIWGSVQPMLDVVYFEQQERSSKQINKHSGSVVIDEVGTGKTVTALYAIRDVIQSKIEGELAHVLVVCPYNKREDWQSDIRRQLGRYAHIVDQGDSGIMYSNNMKKAFFRNKEHILMVAGQKQSERDKNGSYSALKETIESYSDGENWDLVIIDEAHVSFNNYKDICADKVMVLTATPIVVNSFGKRTFQDYKGLISGITGTDFNKYEIDPIQRSIPTEEDIYVNWFREDFGRRAAERKIKFISCSRHNKRDELYGFIKEEKGELAALTYDQDDNYLFYAAKEEYGYDDVPELTRNGKLNELIKILKENDKSYIVFCEHQFVVDLIFDAVKNIFVEDVVAAKYGKYENQSGLGNVQDGQLINTLMQSLRNEKRVIFITTGKSGGTGLNLGEFDGVIHYELPFTSIELEQRFGRVDRVDTQKKSRKKDMIFLLNKCTDSENDIDVNRMLYYCTTKIDVTCQYMPIRNTVLYYPEFIKRNGMAIRESLEKFKYMKALSEENEARIKDIRKTRRVKESAIRKNENWSRITSMEKSVFKNCEFILSHEKRAGVPDSFYEELSQYVKFVEDNKGPLNEYQRAYRQFIDARKFVNNWLSIIGLTKMDEKSEVFVGYSEKEDGEAAEEEFINNTDADETYNEEQQENEVTTIQGQIKELMRKIDEIDMDNLELQGFSSEGVFCCVDNQIKRSTVEDYRKGLLLK